MEIFTAVDMQFMQSYFFSYKYLQDCDHLYICISSGCFSIGLLSLLRPTQIRIENND